ncbi:MAG: JAB domain-containing protein [Candidatus Edwardsbacteria bacterium]|nr:JAB domain-containing protein [Candidatus Edwardsbacteria bacterium]
MSKYKRYPLEIIRVSETIHSIPMSNPKTVFEYMKDEALADRELFFVLHLNTKNRIIKKELTAMGAVDHCAISPGIVLRGAVASGAAGIITVHNHPSGDPTPSIEDRQLWRTMGEVCRLLGIRLLDNLVIGADGFYSEEQHK